MRSEESQMAFLEMSKDVDFIKKVLNNELGIQYQGGDRYNCKFNDMLDNQAAIEEELERYLNVTNNIRGNKKVKYWLYTISRAFGEIKRKAEKETMQQVAFDSKLPESTELDKLLVAMTGKVDPVHRAVLQHFMWQVKRKLAGLPVTYHMMPIVWGKQKSGKSETVKKLLAPISGYVYNGLAFNQIGDDRYYKSFHLNLVIFFDEMRKVDKVDIEALKQIITAPLLTYRILGKNSYATVPQRSTMIGVSNLNPSSLIKDDTGMRRFFYIETLDKMNFEMLATVDFAGIWRAVDERRDNPYILDYFNEIDQLQDSWRQRSNIEMFIEECGLVKDDGAELPFKTVYETFSKFAQDQGHVHMYTKQNLLKLLEEQYGFKFFSKKLSSTATVKMIKALLPNSQVSLLTKIKG